MINPVESGLDLFSAIVRDMFKTDCNYGIYKNYNMLQESQEKITDSHFWIFLGI